MFDYASQLRQALADGRRDRAHEIILAAQTAANAGRIPSSVIDDLLRIEEAAQDQAE